MTVIQEHGGAFTSSTVFTGEIRLAPRSYGYSLVLQLASFTGSLVGATITIENNAPVPFSANTPYQYDVYAKTVINYTITLAFAATTPLRMSARAVSAYVVDQQFVAYSTLGNLPTWTITPNGWLPGDQIILCVFAKCLHNQNLIPTTSPSFNLLANTYSYDGYYEPHIVFAKEYAGESTVSVTVPSGWYGGGWLYDNTYGGFVTVVRDASSPVQAADVDIDSYISPVSSGTVGPQSPMTDNGIVFAFGMRSASFSNGGIGLGSIFGGLLLVSAKRDTILTPPTIPVTITSGSYNVASAVGVRSNIETVYAGGSDQVGWQIGVIGYASSVSGSAVILKSAQAQPALPGGSTPFGSSISWTAPISAQTTDISIAQVFTMSSTSNLGFTPDPGWVVIDSTQVQEAGSLPGNTAPPYGETYTGNNPSYIKCTTMYALGTVGNTVSGSFAAGTYHLATVDRFSGVHTTYPIIGVASYHRTFVGSNNPSFVWSPTFTETLTVPGRGVGYLLGWYGGGPIVPRYPTSSQTITRSNTGAKNKAMFPATDNSYTITPGLSAPGVFYGSGIAVEVVLRQA